MTIETKQIRNLRPRDIVYRDGLRWFVVQVRTAGTVTTVHLRGLFDTTRTTVMDGLFLAPVDVRGRYQTLREANHA